MLLFLSCDLCFVVSDSILLYDALSIDHFARCKQHLQDVNNTGPETLPVSVCNCFLYFTCKENILKMFI